MVTRSSGLAKLDRPRVGLISTVTHLKMNRPKNTQTKISLRGTTRGFILTLTLIWFSIASVYVARIGHQYLTLVWIQQPDTATSKKFCT